MESRRLIVFKHTDYKTIHSKTVRQHKFLLEDTTNDNALENGRWRTQLTIVCNTFHRNSNETEDERAEDD